MAPERHNPADPETMRDLFDRYEDPGTASGFLTNTVRKIRALRDEVHNNAGLKATLTFLGVLGADEALANYPELDELTPAPFSQEVNGDRSLDDRRSPNLWRSFDGRNPRISWSIQNIMTGDVRVFSEELEPMPGSTFVERPPAIPETSEMESVEAIVVLSDGTRFRHNGLNGSIDRQRPGEPDFSPFITRSVDCIKPGPESFLYITIAGSVYLMPIDYPTPVFEPRGVVAPPASFNDRVGYVECAVEVEEAGFVLVDERLQPLSYLMKRPDGGYDGPFRLPWGNAKGRPTFYVNGTGIWIAFVNADLPPGENIKVFYVILPHPDRDRDGIPNDRDVCPDHEDAHLQDGAACASGPGEPERFGFERYVEPGILIAGATEIIPHPEPPPGIENPRRGVFHGIGGIRSTEAGHLIDMQAELPAPMPGFMWSEVIVEVNVRDGEVVFLGDPPRSFSPGDGPQMLSVTPGFQAILQGTDVEVRVLELRAVPLPDRDAGVGDAGADAGAEAGADGGDGGMGGDIPDARAGEGGAGDGGDPDAADAGARDAEPDAPIDAGHPDVPLDGRVDVSDGITPDIHVDANNGDGEGSDGNDDTKGNGDDLTGDEEQDGAVNTPPRAPGCGACSTLGRCPTHFTFPEMPKGLGSAAVFASLALAAAGLQRRVERRRKKK